MHERVAGLDVHKAMIVACVRIMAGAKVTRECRTFETSTSGLLTKPRPAAASRQILPVRESVGQTFRRRLRRATLTYGRDAPMTALPKLSPARMTLDEFLAWQGDGSRRKFQLAD